jgi:hypothetical protein
MHAQTSRYVSHLLTTPWLTNFSGADFLEDCCGAKGLSGNEKPLESMNVSAPG